MQSASLGSLSMTRSYDQRYQITRIQAGGLEYTYTRDKAGQVTGVSGATIKTCTHDANGKVTSDGVFTYTWDALNRLVKVVKAGAVVATYG